MSRRDPSARSPIRFDPAYPELKSLIIARTGHHYYADKDDLLCERLARRFAATRSRSCADYLAHLGNDGSPEWAALSAEITIGETFFFRYVDQFEALRTTILPDLIRANAAERRLRIWSAGCATGAEPYSLAILVHELLGEKLDDWRVAITGTDINERFLETARAGVFGRWPLRSLTEAQFENYFTPGAAAATWALKPRYRSMVRFLPQNLMAIGTPDWPLNLTDFDLILCRNVLIYFRHETAVAVFSGLLDLLRPQGWMLIGHAEPNPDFSAIGRTVDLPGTVSYRRPDIAAEEIAAPDIPAPPEPTPRPRLRSEKSPAPVADPSRRPAITARPEGAVAVPTPAPATSAEIAIAEALRLADAGDLPKAEAYCHDAIAAHPMAAALYLYAGVIAAARGELDVAEGSLRRALYLDRDFASAHYQLALVLRSAGRRDAARRAFANAGRIAGAMPPDAEIAHLDGMEAGALLGLVKLALETTPVNGR